MIKALTNHNYYLRLAFSLLLLVFTGCKIVTPVYVIVKNVYKEIASVPDTDNDKVEEFTGLNKAFEKSPEFIAFDHSTFSHLLWYTSIKHFTEYIINYQTDNYHTITSPPPDTYLQLSV